MTKKIIYVSIDVESIGPAPIVHSMLSCGAVAVDPTKGKGKDAIVSTWEANFEELPGAKRDPATVKWWETQPEAWKACRENLQDPATAMRSFNTWAKGLGGKPIAVGFPAGFDFTFVYVYFHLLLGECPFGFAALDFKSYAACLLGIEYHESRKRNFPKHWFAKDLPHTHKAIDDALEQGVMLVNAFEDFRSRQADVQKLRLVIENLYAAIRRHRDEKGHDRCWIDDMKLYQMLPEGVADADLTLPPKEEFLRGCERYYELRRAKTHDEADEEARRLAKEGKLGR